MSRTALKAARKAVLSEIEAIISRSQILALDPDSEVVKRNEYRYAEFTVRYPVPRPGVASFPVVSLHATISEKLVALLRRTAHLNRDPSRKGDETLVRHVYALRTLYRR